MKTTNNFKKVTRNFAFFIAIALLVTTVFGSNFATTAKAADTTSEDVVTGNTEVSTEEVSTEVESSTEDDVTVEVEKELVQCSNDWTIFQYDDENGNPTKFDILYMDKTPEELKAEGMEVQYRIIYKSFGNEWLNLDTLASVSGKLYSIESGN